MDSETSAENPIHKRLMFVTGDDFYLLAYNLILFLSHFKFTDEERKFHDSRKLAFILEFVSDGYLARLINGFLKKKDNIPSADLELLSAAYIKGRDRLPYLNRLIYALEQKGFVKVYADQEKKLLDVSLNLEKIPNDFLKSTLFESELGNCQLLKETFSKIRTVGLDSFLENLFRKSGVTTWLD